MTVENQTNYEESFKRVINSAEQKGEQKRVKFDLRHKNIEKQVNGNGEQPLETIHTWISISH